MPFVDLLDRMLDAFRRIGCDPVCDRCLRRFDDVRSTSRLAEPWICVRCGDALNELHQPNWVKS